jgi:hypothetical protein
MSERDEIATEIYRLCRELLACPHFDKDFKINNMYPDEYEAYLKISLRMQFKLLDNLNIKEIENE